MNAHSLYDLTCRLVLEAGSEDYSKWDELNKLLPSLRGALGCTACGNVLIDPHSPKHDICEHHVCRTCLGAIKHNLKPVCTWCKDSELYAENKQLQIVLKCFRKLCEYMKVSPIYLKLLEFAKQGETFELLNIINEFCDENYKSISIETRKHFLNHNQTSCNERDSVVLSRDENNLDVKVEFENINFSNSIDDEVFSEPSTNGEIQTICESDIAPVYKNSDDEDDMYDNSAPILSPITEHINVDHELSDNEDAPMLSPIAECKTEINNYNDDHLKEQKGSAAASISSNTETELNSDSSSMSSISSPVEILPPNIEPSEHPLQEYNITSESVLEFQATDLMGAADVNVLASLEDGSYSDLADITLSYPLTSISEESSKDSVIASIADNILSIQSSLSSDKTCEKTAITTLAASIEAEAIKSISSRVTKPLDKPIKKSMNSLIQNSPINLPTSNLLSLTSTSGSIAKCSMNSSTQIITPCSNILSQSSFPSSSQTTFCKVEPVSHYIRPQYNTHLVSCHSVASSKAPSFTTNINNVNIGTQIIQTPLSCPSQVRNSIHQNIIHQPFVSHHLVQQKTANSSQVIQKHIPPHSIGQSFQSIPGRPNLVVNSSISPVGITRMVLSPQQHSHLIQQQRSAPQNILNSSLQQQKLPSDIHASMNSASIPLSQTNTNLSNNFINIIPEAALVQSTNDNTKVSTKETIMKATSAYCSNASSVFSVKLSEDESTKQKSPTPVNKPYIFNQTVQSPPPPSHILPDESKFNVHHQINNYINQNMKKPPPKPKSKPKPKRKGCRCGNATPSPGKLTCCGQRCPCYVEAKACIDCRCKGCRNPHRPGGKKVRPIIPHQDNIQIHQLQPVSTDRQAVAVQSFHHQPIQPKNNLVSHSIPSSVSTSQTFHAFRGVHAIEPNVVSHQSVVSPHQFVKNCLPQDSCNKIISDGSLSNIIAMKPVKVLFDGNNVIKREYSIDTKMEPTI